MIDKEIHFARQWMVNKIADDFILWDVWEIPIHANNSDSENFQSFYKVALETFKKIEDKKTLAGILFTIRYWLGKVFPLDNNINTLPIPGCHETTIKTRLDRYDIKSNTGKAIKSNYTDLEFRPVYLFETESLHELSNNTVHGLIHVGWIKKDDYYTATLAIYVKPRGIYGKVYLKLIEPFRRHIVYPAMMKAMEAQWQEYLLSKD